MVGFGVEENDPAPAKEEEEQQTCEGGGDGHGVPKGAASSSYGEVSKLIFLPASPKLSSAAVITDIRAFTDTLNLFPYHKILK